MTDNQLYEMAININERWEELKSLKREFVDDKGFYKFIEDAYLLARASDLSD